METCKILTIDDEALALRRLKLVLNSIPFVDHVAEASSCEDALDKIARLRPDLILLDVKMRDGTGFDLIERLSGNHVPQVIFISAFSHFAARAFGTAAVDYVLKPVDSSRLALSIERARRRIVAADFEQELADLKEVVASLRSNFDEEYPSAYETEFWIRENSTGFVRVPVDAVEWVTSEDDYVRLHSKDRSYLLRSSIKKFEERVDPDQFVRIHRTALVRISAIREVRNPPFGSQEVVLHNGQRLKVGRVYAKRFRDALLRRPVRRSSVIHTARTSVVSATG